MAYEFNGTSQRLTVADTAVLDVTGSITLFAHSRRAGNAAVSNSGLIAKWNAAATQRSYNLFVQSSTQYLGMLVSSNGSYQVDNDATASSNALALDTWSATLGRFDASSSVSAWLDGSKIAEKTSSIAASIHSGSADLNIAAQVGNLDYFNGRMAEVAIWSAALTDAEITSLYKGFSPRRVRPQSLVFYAPLIRQLVDTKGALTITNNNSATVAVHPRVY